MLVNNTFVQNVKNAAFDFVNSTQTIVGKADEAVKHLGYDQTASIAIAVLGSICATTGAVNLLKSGESKAKALISIIGGGTLIASSALSNETKAIVGLTTAAATAVLTAACCSSSSRAGRKKLQ